LKAFLEEQVKLARIRKNLKNATITEAGVKAKKLDKFARGKNNSNKFYAFTQFGDDGEAGGNLSD
jgi:hypothetical protein